VSAARVLLALALAISASKTAAAQTTPLRRVDVVVGVRLAGTLSFPAVPVVEGTPGGGERTVFVTRSRIEPSAAAELRISVALSQMIAVEGGLAVGNATLATTIDDDLEAGDSATARESLHQYLVEGGLTFNPPGWQRARWAPFAAVGAGYLRQLHEGRTLLETGRTLYAGAGLRLLLTSPRSSGAASGLRFDLRGALVTGGVLVDDSSRGLPVAHVAYYLRF
jgi:hypothetical protein